MLKKKLCFILQIDELIFVSMAWFSRTVFVTSLPLSDATIRQKKIEGGPTRKLWLKRCKVRNVNEVFLTNDGSAMQKNAKKTICVIPNRDATFELSFATHSQFLFFCIFCTSSKTVSRKKKASWVSYFFFVLSVKQWRNGQKSKNAKQMPYDGFGTKPGHEGEEE